MGITPWSTRTPGQNLEAIAGKAVGRRSVVGGFVRRELISVVVFVAVGLTFFDGKPSLALWLLFGLVAPIILLVVFRSRGRGREGSQTVSTSIRVMMVGAAPYRDPKLTDPTQARKLYPHERVDAARPFAPRANAGAPAGARFSMLVILGGLLGATAIDLRTALDGNWPAMLSLPMLLIVLHRSNFRRVIASANEPYQDGPTVYPRKMVGAIRDGGTARYFAIAVCLLSVAAALASLFNVAAVVWVGFLISVAAAVVLGLASSNRLAQRYVNWSEQEYTRKRYWLDDDNRLGGLLGLRQSVLLSKEAVRFDGDDIIVDPVPPEAQAAYGGLQERILLRGEDEYMIAPDSSMKRIQLTPVTEEERVTRDLYRRTNGLVIAERTEPYLGTEDRPSIVWTLPPTFDEKKMPALQELAAAHRYTVVERDLASSVKTAKVSPVTSIEARVYARAAGLLKINVWDLDMAFTWVNGGSEEARIDEVAVFNAPVAGLTPDKRHDTWRAIISAMPKASNGWEIEDDQQTGQVVLRYGEPLSLPDTFMLKDTAPQCAMPDRWASIPLGVNSKGKVISVNLEKTPHLLIAGGTGSGKSTLLATDMSGRLMRGHQIVTIDTVKGGNDFLTLKPWNLMWGETITEAANILAMIYEESIRRRAYLKRFKVGSWTKLTHEQREEGKIRPLSIFYDEYENSVVERAVPKNLPKDHAIVLSALSHNSSVDFVRHYMQQLAKEARSVGVFLVVATQTPHSARIGEALRANLGGVIQLSGGKLESHIVRLTMGEATGLAMEQFEMFNKPKVDADGREMFDEDDNLIVLPGLAVILRDGGQPTAMRVAYSPEDGRPAILSGSNIPPIQPWHTHDVLDLDMERAIDEDDTRELIDPPFTAMTHLGGTKLLKIRSAPGLDAAQVADDSIESFDEPALGEPEQVALPRRRKKIDLFSS